MRNGLRLDKGKTDSKNIITSIPGVAESIFLNMPHYYQSGQSWSNDIMQSQGLTIGSAGCALTSFTMVTNYYGYTDNPGEVNSKLGSAACPLAWSTAGSKYSLSLVGNISAATSESDAKTFILGALRQNRPVIVGFKKGTSTHFVVARAYLRETYDPSEGLYGEETFYIYDPSSGRDYSYLDDYLAADYYVYSLKVYDN